MDELQPGQVISPRNDNEPPVPAPGAPEPERPEEPAPSPVPSPTPAPEPAAEAATTPEPVPATVPEPAEAAGWQYSQDADVAPRQTQPASQLSWTASEFIAHDKGVGWYALLALAAFVAAAADYLVTHDVVSASVIIVAALAFGAFAARKPQARQYNIDGQGIWVGDKVYRFQDYKTFSLVEEGAAASIVFMPLKRFMPPLTIYMDPAVAAQVVDYLSSFLPFEQHKSDAVDSLLKRIRF